MDHEVTATDAVGAEPAAEDEYLSADSIIARANSEHVKAKAELSAALLQRAELDKKIKKLRDDEKKWGRIVRGARGRGTPKEPTAIVGTPTPPEPVMETATNDDGSPKAMGDYFPSVDD